MTAIVPVFSSLTGVVFAFCDSSDVCDADPMNGCCGPDGKDAVDGDEDEDSCRWMTGKTPADLLLAVVPNIATEVELAANVVNAVAST